MDNRQVTSTPNYLLGQIDAKMTHMLASFAVQKDDIRVAHVVIHQRIDTEAARINKLERAHWKTAGILSLIPIVFTLAGLVIAYINMS